MDFKIPYQGNTGSCRRLICHIFYITCKSCMTQFITLQFISNITSTYVPGFRPIPEFWLSWEYLHQESCRRPLWSSVWGFQYGLASQVAIIKLLVCWDLPHFMNHMARNDSSFGITAYIHPMRGNQKNSPCSRAWIQPKHFLISRSTCSVNILPDWDVSLITLHTILFFVKLGCMSSVPAICHEIKYSCTLGRPEELWHIVEPGVSSLASRPLATASCVTGLSTFNKIRTTTRQVAEM